MFIIIDIEIYTQYSHIQTKKNSYSELQNANTSYLSFIDYTQWLCFHSSGNIRFYSTATTKEKSEMENSLSTKLLFEWVMNYENILCIVDNDIFGNWEIGCHINYHKFIFSVDP